jgi:transcriptional regulator with XRE-family HTH domain
VEDETADGVPTATPVIAGKKTSPDRIGARLAAARIAAGLELVDIARETRVPVRHLRAIEADVHDELPALPYAVGFVKSLARAVGMDPDEAGARFRAETTIVPQTPMAASIEPLDERRLPPRGVVAASVLALVLVLGGLTAYGAGWFDAAVPASTEVAAPAEPAAPPAQAAAPGTDAAGAALVTAPLATGPGVAIAALEDAWIRVTRIDPATGKPVVVKTGLLAKGQRYDLPPDQTGLRLWTGRAGALQISVDGRAVPPLGGPVDTVKNVSLDAADLRARISAPAAAPATTPAGAAVQ